jgi:hypothetical protein
VRRLVAKHHEANDTRQFARVQENKNTNFNTQVIDRRDVPLNQLTDEELLAIASGGLPEHEDAKVLLLPPGPKSTR